MITRTDLFISRRNTILRSPDEIRVGANTEYRDSVLEYLQLPSPVPPAARDSKEQETKYSGLGTHSTKSMSVCLCLRETKKIKPLPLIVRVNPRRAMPCVTNRDISPHRDSADTAPSGTRPPQARQLPSYGRHTMAPRLYI